MQRASTGWETLGAAAVLSGAGLVAGSLYLRYLATLGPGAQAAGGPQASAVALRADIITLMAALVLCSVIGALLARRYGLPGWLGDRQQLWRAAPMLAGAAALLSALAYLAFGRSMAALVPGAYPSSVGWAAVRVAKGALVDEVIARWGLFTVFAGATRRLWLANGLQALMATFIGLASMAALAPELGFGPLFWLSVLASFGASLGLGVVCLRYGLLAAMGVRVLFDLRFVAHALLG